MTVIKGKVCLIVGASSGIGRALALQLARRGAILALTARREDRLLALKAEIEALGGQCEIRTADATNSQESAAVVGKFVDIFKRVDIAILNAGGAPAVDMREIGAEDVNHYMRTNYDVTVNYLFPVLEVMKRQRDGFVLHTNSLAGFLGIPLQGPYSAAKGATRLLLDTCRLEFEEYGIKFCNVYPGFVATEATQGDGMPAPLEISEDQAATHLIYALEKEKKDYMFPWPMRWLVRLALLLPGFIVRMILRQDVPSRADTGTR
ncbi:MAG: SDR family NAD(P)-dependent oxidoreductase [Halioglobus sp.]